MTTSFTAVDEPFQFETLSQSTGDDLFYDKKKDAQDIVSALQSSFNFLQDSEIDEDGKWFLPICLLSKDNMCVATCFQEFVGLDVGKGIVCVKKTCPKVFLSLKTCGALLGKNI